MFHSTMYDVSMNDWMEHVTVRSGIMSLTPLVAQHVLKAQLMYRVYVLSKVD